MWAARSVAVKGPSGLSAGRLGGAVCDLVGVSQIGLECLGCGVWVFEIVGWVCRVLTLNLCKRF